MQDWDVDELELIGKIAEINSTVNGQSKIIWVGHLVCKREKYSGHGIIGDYYADL